MNGSALLVLLLGALAGYLLWRRYDERVTRIVEVSRGVQMLVILALYIFVLLGLASSNSLGLMILASLGTLLAVLIVLVVEPHKDLRNPF